MTSTALALLQELGAWGSIPSHGLWGCWKARRPWERETTSATEALGGETVGGEVFKKSYNGIRSARAGGARTRRSATGRRGEGRGHPPRANERGAAAGLICIRARRSQWARGPRAALRSCRPARAARLIRRMAAATACGSPPPRPPRKRGDSRRRQAALFFLNNISLDGRPPCPPAEKPPQPAGSGEGEEAAAEPAGAPPRLLPPPPVCQPPPALLLPGVPPLAAAGAKGDADAARGGIFLPQLLLGGPLCPPPPAPPALPGMLAAAKPGAPGLLSPSQSAAGGGFALEAQRQRRRFISQRCSLDFLEDIVEYASVRRTKHISGSPRHKSLKKMHFIKNMRQYDTKNSRIVLICAKRTLCVAFSILPYGEGLRISDLKMEGQKQRHPSGGVSVSTEMVLGLEGVELGADGKVVSYAKFLYPTNALVVRKADGYGAVPSCRASAPRSLPGSRYKPVTAKTIPAGTDIGSEAGEAAEYDPNLLDDPQWPCGKHKRVLIFASYMTTVIEYVKPSDLKKDMNETFREKFPHIKLTLSKIRSLKREMRNLSEECNLEPVTVSMAYVYFEKLVLQGKLNKQNRKLCAGACVLLAAKISSDLRKHEVKHLIDKLEERFRFNRRDLIGFEFTVLVALELALYLPENQVLPHYRRLTQQS
ncbi:CDK5 and ABL1 enzyme substrate 2 [Empidonax traillii]|uniref:CDK5 and ABL1 enzyme substrate 2 n=1 Tax=Empidonax traillii TaxID=164674 RepID=UPI000FFDB66A|nr:CDK5 and ABL1 enzyme substrate 2 [Empidonax traillii]